MKKSICLILTVLLALTLCACGESKTAEPVDLKAACDAAIAQVSEELGDDAPVLMEETSMDLLGSLYAGIGDIELKQSVFYLSPTYTSCEIAMVETASAADAQTVKAIFEARVDLMANDTMYPDEAGLWKNGANVTVNGNYVVLSVLPEGCTVPDALLAKF